MDQEFNPDKNLDDIRTTILEFVNARAPHANTDDSTPLLEGGNLDSLGILQLMMFLGESYGIEIADEDFVAENFETVESLTRFVVEKKSQAA